MQLVKKDLILNIFYRLLIIYLLSFPVFAQVSVEDDAGNIVLLDAPAQRVITLAPHLTEIIYAIHAESTLVATVSYSNFPPEAKKIPRVGGYNNIDLESIIRYQPDLVIAWKSGNNQNQIKKIKNLGIAVFLNEPRVIEDVSRTASRLGVLTGRNKQASEFSEQFNRHYAELKQQYQSKSPVKLFYQIWHQPLMTINGEHLISDVIHLCGAINVFADVSVLAPTINVEAVLLADPQMIVTGGMGRQQPEWLDDWKHWPDLAAVKYRQLYYINPDLIQRHGPRILQGAEILCKQVDQARNRLSKH